MPHKLRYARQQGFRRLNRAPYMAQFGYGGAGYGGYGRKGQYGGYRSYYPYHVPMKHTYETPQGPPALMVAKKASIEDWIPSRAYSDSTTFWFGMALIGIIVVGVFFGMRRRPTHF